MNGPITVETSADWEKIRAQNLKVVVDPMVYRTADVFLRGLPGILRSPEPKALAEMWYRLDPAGERATGGWGDWVGEEPAAQSGWNGTGGGVGSRDEWT